MYKKILKLVVIAIDEFILNFHELSRKKLGNINNELFF